MAMSGAQIIARALRTEGVDTIFTLAGDHILPLLDTLQLGLYGKAVVTDLAPSRYDLVAQGLGAHGELVERPEEFGPALDRALSADGPALLNIRVRSEISPRAQAVVASRKFGGGL